MNTNINNNMIDDEDDDNANSSLKSLKDEPLKVQLEALFGVHEADQFLNPTFQDRVKNNTSPSTISKNHSGPIGVEELWDSLRLQSQEKLAKRTPDKHGYSRRTNVMTDEQKLERKVVVYRQRLQLMHRIALLNVSKSKKLIGKVNLPKITGDWYANMMPEEREKIDSRCVEEDNNLLENDDSSRKFPEIHTSRENNLITPRIEKNDSQKKCEIMMDNKPHNICFVSNKELSVPGQFQERMKHHGVESSVGISNASHFYKKQKNKFQPSTSKTPKYKDVGKTMPSSTSFVASKKGTLWHPLTMNKMMECLDNLSPSKSTVHCT